MNILCLLGSSNCGFEPDGPSKHFAANPLKSTEIFFGRKNLLCKSIVTIALWPRNLSAVTQCRRRCLPLEKCHPRAIMLPWWRIMSETIVIFANLLQIHRQSTAIRSAPAINGVKEFYHFVLQSLEILWVDGNHLILQSRLFDVFLCILKADRLSLIDCFGFSLAWEVIHRLISFPP